MFYTTGKSKRKLTKVLLKKNCNQERGTITKVRYERAQWVAGPMPVLNEQNWAINDWNSWVPGTTLLCSIQEPDLRLFAHLRIIFLCCKISLVHFYSKQNSQRMVNVKKFSLRNPSFSSFPRPGSHKNSFCHRRLSLKWKYFTQNSKTIFP